MIKKILILALACVGMTGCVPHFKEADSYNTMFRNDEVTAPGKGDPYTFGGIAEGSGGTFARQSYATDNVATDARDDTASLGELAKDRTHTPGGLPGQSGTLPGAGNSNTQPDTTIVEIPGAIDFVDKKTGKEIKPGDPGFPPGVPSNPTQTTSPAPKPGTPKPTGSILHPHNGPDSGSQSPRSGGDSSGG